MKNIRKRIFPAILLFAIAFAAAYFWPKIEPTVTPFLQETGLIEMTEPQEPIAAEDFDYDTIPPYSGAPYISLNGGVPYFTEQEIAEWSKTSFETYGTLDSLGRCTACVSNIGQDLMPKDEREPISSVKPTGWVPQLESPAVYNRCHLIGFQLTGENANKQNLVTGTRALNVDGMLPYENLVSDYIKETGNHVLYRVTPIFIDDELVCRGILMEGYSVEDTAVRFCIYCYNNQQGITIDYTTGEYTKN